VLEGAVLEGSVLEGAVLDGAVLEGAVLEGAVLEGAVLDGAVPAVVVEAFDIGAASPAPSGRQDASMTEIGIANAAGIKRRRVIQVGC
jgi:uncharacterized protein YjbI with pentapeptide repeats